MRKKSRGFIFVETIVVIAVVSFLIISLYSLSISYNNNLKISLNDDAKNLYEAYYLKKFYNTYNLDNLVTTIKEDNLPYLNIKENNLLELDEEKETFLNNLYYKLNISNVWLMNFDNESLITCENDLIICQNSQIKNYIEENKNEGIKLVIAYQDNDFFTSVKVGES